MTAKKKKVGTRNDFDALRGQLARALADYDNLQKRVEKEKDQYRTLAKIEFLAKALPVLDDFEKVQKHTEDAGLSMAVEGFRKLLEGEGLERIDAGVETDFDEEVHEAVEVVDKKGKSGKIVEEVVSGWKMNGVLIRPAKVKVTKK